MYVVKCRCERTLLGKKGIVVGVFIIVRGGDKLVAVRWIIGRLLVAGGLQRVVDQSLLRMWIRHAVGGDVAAVGSVRIGQGVVLLLLGGRVIGLGLAL